MTTPQPPAPNPRITQQFLFTAVAESLLILGVVLLFYITPVTTLTMVIAAIALALGLVAAVYTIYCAVRLMQEPTGRTVAYLSILLVVFGPIMIFALSFVLPGSDG